MGTICSVWLSRTHFRAVTEYGPIHDLLAFCFKKELYLFLCDHPLIIDSGALSFSLDKRKRTGKKCFMKAASELGITWGWHTYVLESGGFGFRIKIYKGDWADQCLLVSNSWKDKHFVVVSTYSLHNISCLQPIITPLRVQGPTNTNFSWDHWQTNHKLPAYLCKWVYGVYRIRDQFEIF